jgi:hypothetical protein
MPEYTTLAVGEEEPIPITTLALGEETPPTSHWAEDGPSTRMYGEEGEFVPDLPVVGDPFGGF